MLGTERFDRRDAETVFFAFTAVLGKGPKSELLSALTLSLLVRFNMVMMFEFEFELLVGRG